jgi:hypothetical protein
MATDFQWDRGLLATETGEFDRALHRLRRVAADLRGNPSLIGGYALLLKEQPGITRREFDRRFRLVVSAIADDDPQALQAIALHLRDTSPEALNAVRTILPAQLKHLAVQLPAGPRQVPAIAAVVKPVPQEAPVRIVDPQQATGRFGAVALIGTADEHVRNEALLRSVNLNPLRLPTIDQLWDVVTTGLCGFVIGSSAWGHIPASDHRRSIRRLCEYSTFLFVRISVDGISPSIAQTFSRDAAEARCGPLDGQKFCHGLDCDLTPGDIDVLLSTTRFLEGADTADFFPLGLSELDASLLRLIAADRRHPENPVTIRKLGTRELAGGQSGARVFMLSDGIAQPFVAKVGEAELLKGEINGYRKWIKNWEPSVTDPLFHSHVGSAAISYRLQATPDGNHTPAPTLEECLEQLRLSEGIASITVALIHQTANDLFQGLTRVIERLVTLNSQSNSTSEPTRFWLHWPISAIAEKGIDYEIIDQDWQPLSLSELVTKALSILEPNLARGVIHGDIHGRNILLLDRSPAFIDFALSGPGHPLEDLVRLDSVVRSTAMRMLVDEHTMREIMKAIHIDGATAEAILQDHPVIAASPLAGLSVRTAVKVREAALKVAEAHSLGLPDLLAMMCVVAGHVLVAHNPCSGVERLLLSVTGSRLLANQP